MVQAGNERLMNVTFISEWNNKKLIQTNAKFNWQTGEVVDVETSDEEVEGVITRQYIEFADGVQFELDSEDFEEERDELVQNEVVLSSDGSEKGYIIGEDDESDCGVESCTGTNYRVYWEDGSISICCGKGLKTVGENTYQII